MNPKKTFFIIFVSLGTFIVLSLSLYSYERFLRVLPENTFLENVTLSGMNREQALTALQTLIEERQKRTHTIILNEENTKEFTSLELGIKYDLQKTVSNIFHRTSWFANATSGPANIYLPVVHFKDSQIGATLNEYLLTEEKDFQDAEIIWKDSVWTIQHEAPGLVLKEGELERVIQEIKINAKKTDASEPILIHYESVEPMNKVIDLQPLLDSIHEKLSKPLVLIFEQEKSEMNLNDQNDWILVDAVEKTFVLNEIYSKERIEAYAKERDVKTSEVIISAVEEHTSEYDKKIYKRAVYTGDFTHGKAINREKIFGTLNDLFNDPSLERNIIVEWETHLPTIASQVEGYDFPQILSTGISTFRYGNHPNRVKNIKLSLESFQGVVINPGEEFSFNRVTGWITPFKGYTKTQVIMEGRVEEGVGGGVCQTSTTMYRSILNAGVQVTERRNHTLDIVYYHDYGYGLDATVYTDSRNDLKFINTFPGPIIINTFTDDNKKEAYVEFYGTTDERRVELTQIPTGDFLLKKWAWKIIWPDKVEERLVQSRYQLPKEEEKPVNPLEG